MEKIPTAEEVISKIVKFETTNDTIECTVHSLIQVMIKFAKLHVEAALDAKDNNLNQYGMAEEGYENAYPLENIK